MDNNVADDARRFVESNPSMNLRFTKKELEPGFVPFAGGQGQRLSGAALAASLAKDGGVGGGGGGVGYRANTSYDDDGDATAQRATAASLGTGNSVQSGSRSTKRGAGDKQKRVTDQADDATRMLRARLARFEKAPGEDLSKNTLKEHGEVEEGSSKQHPIEL